MKEFLNKHVWIHIKIDNGKDMYYDANVNSITDTHITITDKFGNLFTYRISDIVEIKIYKKRSDDQ